MWISSRGAIALEEVRGDIHWSSHGRGFFTQLQVHPRWQCDEVKNKIKQKVGTKKKNAKTVRMWTLIMFCPQVTSHDKKSMIKEKKYISNEIGISEYHSIFLWYPYFTDISMKHPVFFIRYPYLALHPACLPGLHTLKPSSEPWRTTYRPRNRKFVNAFRTEAPAPGKCFCFPFGRLT
jgi:hypothetical protein